VSSEAKLGSVSHSVESGKSEIKRDVSTTNFSVINSSSKVSTSDKMSSVIGDFKGTKTVTINDVDITIDNDTTISDFMSAINTSDAGVKLSYNSISGTFALETKETGVAQTISLSDENDTKSVFASLGFDTSVTARGTDATIVVDGVTAVSNTNSLAFDEFTADITYATTGETFIVKTDKDTDAIYNMLSDFVSEYNELISGIRSTTTEQRSEGTNGYYEPLTDDEKKEMSESEITKWEAEAKKGLLHSDTLLTGFLSKARATFYSATSVNSNGQKVGLYNLGITTSSDTTKAGELSIDESKLKAAIEDDPDTLMELVNTITDNLNTVVNTYVGSNGLISNKAGIEGTSTEYNNSLYTQITEVKEKMSTELTRLQSKEERYYEMFSNMETLVSDNNTTLDLLTSYFG
jgi:flagellar hook-associated protein 2